MSLVRDAGRPRPHAVIIEAAGGRAAADTRQSGLTFGDASRVRRHDPAASSRPARARRPGARARFGAVPRKSDPPRPRLGARAPPGPPTRIPDSDPSQASYNSAAIYTRPPVPRALRRLTRSIFLLSESVSRQRALLGGTCYPRQSRVIWTARGLGLRPTRAGQTESESASSHAQQLENTTT